MKFDVLNLTKQALPLTMGDGSTSIPGKGKLEGIEAAQLGTADVARKRKKGQIKLIQVREAEEPQAPFQRKMPPPPTSKKGSKPAAKPTAAPAASSSSSVETSEGADASKTTNKTQKKPGNKSR